MFKNIYFYRARLLPALITSIPMLIFINKVLAVEYGTALNNVFDVLPVIVHLGLSAAIIFLCIQVNRFLAKEIFQRLYFREELFMPTTNHLLWRDGYYVDSIKTKIRSKISSEYGIVLLNPLEEQRNENGARKLIATGVSQIRVALAGNRMLLQHNIEYGFCRNLIGGCVLSILFSALILFYGFHGNIENLKTVGILLFLIYLLPILLSRMIIRRFGKYYSKILFEQFLSL